jgi:hypothetical protein
MEYPTFFTSLGAREHDPEWPMIEFVTIHEFGHGYYYGLLASNEFEEPFLDEGLNDFWDVRMMHSQGMRVRFRTPWMRKLGVALTPWMEGFEFERLGGAIRDQPDPLADNSWHRTGDYGFVYSGTAVRFHDLEEILGGDALAKGFKEYYRRWKFRHPSTADFEKALAEGSGKPEAVAAFFADHVYGARPIDDRVLSLESEEEKPELGVEMVDGKPKERDSEQVEAEVKAAREAWRKAHGDQRPKKEGPGPYPFKTTVVVRRAGADVPQEVLVKFADGTEKRVEWPVGERFRRFEFHTPTRAESAQLDPKRRYLSDWNKLDEGRTIEPHRQASRRWTLEAAAWLQTLLALVEAL